MKKREVITYLTTAVLIGGFATACHAGFLHRTYQGSFVAHDHQYVVNVDGTINIQTKELSNYYVTSAYGYSPAPCGCSLAPCGCPQTAAPDWETKFTFQNEDELKNVIGDLQEVQKEIDTTNAEK